MQFYMYDKETIGANSIIFRLVIILDSMLFTSSSREDLTTGQGCVERESARLTISTVYKSMWTREREVIVKPIFQR